MNDDILRREKELLEKEKRQLKREAAAKLVEELKEAPTMDAELFKEAKRQTVFLESIQKNVVFFAVVLVIQLIVGGIWALILIS